MTEYFKKINLQGAALSFELCIDHLKYSPLAYHISNDGETSKVTISGVSTNNNDPGECTVDLTGTETQDPETALSENYTLFTAPNCVLNRHRSAKLGLISLT